MAEIKIKIWPDGSKAELSVEGAPGEACISLTKKLEESMFAAGSDKKLTEEYFMEEVDVIATKI